MAAWHASDIEINDRVTLPPFNMTDRLPGQEARRVLAVTKHLDEGYVVVELDGLAPRTLSADLEVRIIARAVETRSAGYKKPRSAAHSREKRDWLKHGRWPHTKVRRSF